MRASTSARRSSDPELVQRLIDAGADRTIRDGDGQTAADRMRSTQDLELLSVLE